VPAGSRVSRKNILLAPGAELRENQAEPVSQRRTSMPGPKPTPTHLRLLRGNPGKRPIGRELEPPRTTEPPEPPNFLVGYALDEWWRVAPGLWQLGLLSPLDVSTLAAYCQAYKHWRTAEELLAGMAERDPATSALLVRRASGDVGQNPVVRIAANAAADMVRYAAEFGFSPAARSRVAAGIARETASSKFDGLITCRL
jgi:P27 family predicted phage terminase small subunit